MSNDSWSIISPAQWKKLSPANRDPSLRNLVISLHGEAVELRFPDSIEADLRFLFPKSAPDTAVARTCITIKEGEESRYSIWNGSTEIVADLTRVELSIWLIEEVAEALIARQETALALHAGAVMWQGTSIMLAGVSGAGKSSLAAWLVGKGFDYLSDEIVLLKEDRILGFPRAIVIKSGAAEKVQTLEMFERMPAAKYGSHLIISPIGAKDDESWPCGMIVFPQYKPDGEFRVEALTAADAGLRLVACNLNARNFTDGGFSEIARLSRLVPAISVEYGDFAQLEDRLDVIAHLTIERRLTGAELRVLSASFSSVASPKVEVSATVSYPIPAATPRKEASPKLTIGMATYDDYDGVYFSLQAMRLYHPEVVDETEFLLVDNHPDGPCAATLKSLEYHVPNFRYVPNNLRRGTSVRNFIFEEAASKFVLCMDSHVFVVPGGLKRLLHYFEANEETLDLVQGPLLYDDLASLSTHFNPEWREGMYGTWACDERGQDPDAPPFDIPMQGLGLFACRRAAWPGFNPKFQGFGGEEGYIHEKFRRRGGRTLCLPFLRWMHRFNRPLGLPYNNTWEDRIRNYAIGFRELGLGTGEIEEHFSTLLGSELVKSVFRTMAKEFDS